MVIVSSTKFKRPYENSTASGASVTGATRAIKTSGTLDLTTNMGAYVCHLFIYIYLVSFVITLFDFFSQEQRALLENETLRRQA